MRLVLALMVLGLFAAGAVHILIQSIIEDWYFTLKVLSAFFGCFALAWAIGELYQHIESRRK